MKPRRFKLIKEYPYYEQLKNGIIIEYDNIREIYFYQIHPDKCILFNKHEVENYPEFWQEIKNENWIDENIPKWRDKDMIEFSHYCYIKKDIVHFKQLLEEWKRAKLNDN